jgi:hypothetical protein
VKKYGRAEQATDANITRRVRFACWITKTTDTLRIFNTYCSSTTTVGYTNAAQYYVTLPVLLNFEIGGTQSNRWALKV